MCVSYDKINKIKIMWNDIPFQMKQNYGFSSIIMEIKMKILAKLFPLPSERPTSNSQTEN